MDYPETAHILSPHTDTAIIIRCILYWLYGVQETHIFITFTCFTSKVTLIFTSNATSSHRYRHDDNWIVPVVNYIELYIEVYLFQLHLTIVLRIIRYCLPSCSSVLTDLLTTFFITHHYIVIYMLSLVELHSISPCHSRWQS